jgi:hypothetical protein
MKMKNKRRKRIRIEAITPRNLNFSTDDIVLKFRHEMFANAGELLI